MKNVALACNSNQRETETLQPKTIRTPEIEMWWWFSVAGPED